jgi:hypothetical protein
MGDMQEVHSRVQALLGAPPYGLAPEEKSRLLLDLLKELIEGACCRNERFRNYVNAWPTPLAQAREIDTLPYLPVSAFKANPPLSLVAQAAVRRVLTSSATTGQEPSRVVLDANTARLMAKGVMAITRDFIGSSRRPYLVVDFPAAAGTGPQLGARGAAIQGLQSFATETFYCLMNNHGGEPQTDVEGLLRFVKRQKETGVLVYGFTYMLWTYLVRPLWTQGICLELPNVHVFHSGGWKKLQEQAVDKTAFNDGVARVFGCSPDRVIDFLGMVENVGIIYPDCAQGNKHAPAFGEAIVRNPLTLEKALAGTTGLLQVCSVLPTSFPGYLLLTDDMAEVVAYDGCGCGRRGIAFRFAGRVPKSEIRGCGNVHSSRPGHGNA